MNPHQLIGGTTRSCPVKLTNDLRDLRRFCCIRLALGLSVAILFSLFAPSFEAQSSGSPDREGVVLVKSWKEGSGKVAEQVLSLTLRNKFPEYELEIPAADNAGKRYQLRLVAQREHTIRTPGLPCWVADFREVVKDRAVEGRLLGNQLLSVEGPGVGDNFPREEWAGHFCPIEKSKEALDGRFYPVRTERRFQIEQFQISMQVMDYDYDKETALLKKLDVRVEFKNLSDSENSVSKIVPAQTEALRLRRIKSN